MSEVNGKNIMVVDDVAENLRLLVNMLTGAGYVVRAFPRGAMALRAAALSPPDLFLLDITMPEMDGYELCSKLKSDDKLKDIPVIFLSALNETKDKLKAFAQGGVDYITKPFQFEEVQARVATHLELRHLRLELQEQNEQLAANIRRLKELEKLRDDLTHMMVHDLRSPLMGITGGLELVKMKLEKRLPEAWEMVERTIDNASLGARMLVDMISDMLDVNRLEASKMPLKKEESDIKATVEKGIEMLGGLLVDHRVEVNSKEDVKTSLDPDVIKRVVANLVGNAAKFTPSGKKIEVSVTCAHEAVHVAVHDEGPGIPEEHCERIFDKFGQVENKEDKCKYSTGLGLTFCKLAIEAHGGQIGVKSKRGEGSTFWFTLPASDA